MKHYNDDWPDDTTCLLTVFHLLWSGFISADDCIVDATRLHVRRKEVGNLRLNSEESRHENIIDGGKYVNKWSHDHDIYDV